MKAIEFNNVSFKYDNNSITPALNDVSFSIEEGEFVTIIGHNGSGKSTLARLCNKLLTPTRGNINVFGMDTFDKTNQFEIRKSVGVVFQNPDNQMVASIVEDDIAFGPENIGLDREEIGRRIDFALSSVGMQAYRSYSPSRLSGGQKQRIAIAGVLAIKPRVLILDESTAMLDPKGRKEVLKVVKELNEKEKITVILITHYMDETLIADRTILLNKGEIVLDGTPKEIFAKGRELEKYSLALPPIAEIAQMLREGGMPIGDSYDEFTLAKEICKLLQKK